MELNKHNVKKILEIVFFSIAFYFLFERFEAVKDILYFLWNVVFVFVMGGTMAFIFNVPMKKLEKHIFPKKDKLSKLRRPIAYLTTLILVVLVMFLVMFIVIPELASTLQLLVVQIQQLYNNIPGYISDFSQNFPQFGEYVGNLQINWNSLLQNAIVTVQAAFSGLLNSGTWLLTGVISGVTSFIMSFIFSIYLLFSKEKLSEAIKKILYAFLKEDVSDKIIYVAKLSNKMFSNFLSGQCLEAVILGFMFFIAMTIFKMPYAVLIGVAIAVTALIPIFGAFIGCGLGAFLIVMVNPMQAMWFVIMFLVLQQIEGNVIYPRVVGNSIGLPPILVFIAVIIGGNLMGIAGMLIFIPICSVLYTIIRDTIVIRLKNKDISQKKLL